MAIKLTCGNKQLKIGRCGEGCEDLENRVATLETRTEAMREKLNGIQEGAEVNVQSDWTETNTEFDSYIKNKPTIDTAMSDTSPNAVQNNVIKAYVDAMGDKTFVHNQSTASAVWEIIHGLGKYPSVTVIDGENELAVGEIAYNSEDKLTLTFSEPITGMATLN